LTDFQPPELREIQFYSSTMPRIVCTSPFPPLPVEIPGGALVVTPHSPVAEAARRPKVTLQSLARKILAKHNLFAADPRVAARLLYEAIIQVSPQADATAVSRRIGPVLQTVPRVGTDTDDLRRYCAYVQATLHRGSYSPICRIGFDSGNTGV
jgi:hypothetical protein